MRKVPWIQYPHQMATKGRSWAGGKVWPQRGKWWGSHHLDCDTNYGHKLTGGGLARAGTGLCLACTVAGSRQQGRWWISHRLIWASHGSANSHGMGIHSFNMGMVGTGKRWETKIIKFRSPIIALSGLEHVTHPWRWWWQIAVILILVMNNPLCSNLLKFIQSQDDFA